MVSEAPVSGSRRVRAPRSRLMLAAPRTCHSLSPWILYFRISCRFAIASRLVFVSLQEDCSDSIAILSVFCRRRLRTILLLVKFPGAGLCQVRSVCIRVHPWPILSFGRNRQKLYGRG